MKLGPVDYLSLVAPAGYRCECGAVGVKLWRPVHANSPLTCAACAEREGKLTPGSVDDEGRYSDHDLGGLRTDQVAGLLPCVPAPEGDTSWGSSVPTAGVAWWRALPTYDPAEPHDARLRRMVGEYASSAATWEELYKRQSESSSVTYHRAFALASLARDITEVFNEVVRDLRPIAAAEARPDFARELAAAALAKLRRVTRPARELLDDPREVRNDELVQLRADAVALDGDAETMAGMLSRIFDASKVGGEAPVSDAIAAAERVAGPAVARTLERCKGYDFLRPGAELVRELKEILGCLREKPSPYLEQIDRRLAALLSKGDR